LRPTRRRRKRRSPRWRRIDPVNVRDQANSMARRPRPRSLPGPASPTRGRTQFHNPISAGPLFLVLFRSPVTRLYAREGRGSVTRVRAHKGTGTCFGNRDRYRGLSAPLAASVAVPPCSRSGTRGLKTGAIFDPSRIEGRRARVWSCGADRAAATGILSDQVAEPRTALRFSAAKIAAKFGLAGGGSGMGTGRGRGVAP
jgi:hypothetical protein